MANNYDWARSFTVDFSLLNGLSKTAESSKRYLSKVANMFCDGEAAAEMLKGGDPLVYEFYELGVPENAGDIAFGTSITYPGKVGKEFYMTKGHFHTVLETAEVYFCLSGEGGMIFENPEGDVTFEEFRPGAAVYVPQRYAHRSVNTGSEPLVTFFAFRGDAGHDYGTIETKGYRKLVVAKDGGGYELMDNPKWVG
ncbi:MAG: cupin domain-containing protein [Clostridiales Family XIII bacterium]|jgi:glucose-6-phosphate isomerase|nr:cupin domain-containing protein [Clostridiales Family XIII bacterium]